MAGYNGFSKSNNAIDAEINGCYPLTKTVEIVSKATVVKSSLVKRIVKSIESSEYHHTSNHYNITYYYDSTNLEALLNAVKENNPDFVFADYDWDALYREELQNYENGKIEFCGCTLTTEEVLMNCRQ